MDVMNTPNSTLLDKCQKLLPKIRFIEASSFYWSPRNNSVYMNNEALADQAGQWALLHESGHALSNHQSYQTDAGLLILEVEAWRAAVILGKKLGVVISEDHVQECLNTYRDWLYARSTCPTCSLNSLQIDETTYLCINCSCKWSVSSSRFCRPYRMQDRHKKTPSELPQTVFM